MRQVAKSGLDPMIKPSPKGPMKAELIKSFKRDALDKIFVIAEAFINIESNYGSIQSKRLSVAGKQYLRLIGSNKLLRKEITFKMVKAIYNCVSFNDIVKQVAGSYEISEAEFARLFDSL